MQEHFKIATRGSLLALWQANYIRSKLLAIKPNITIELVTVKTKGDMILDTPLAKIGGKGLFVKEIEEALLDGRADLAVHSIKDVPMVLPEGFLLGCMPKREIASDCFLSHKFGSISDLPKGAHVGTSSLRREAQLLAMRSDLVIENLRGNVDTRLRKLKEGQFDAIILASAALKRLNFTAPYMADLDVESFLPAVGQGALGIECLEQAYDVLVLLAVLEDRETRVCVEAERAMLRGLNGSCDVPIAGHATLIGSDKVRLVGLVADLDGSTCIRKMIVGEASDAEDLGAALAQELLDAGGREILAKLTEANC